MTTVKKAVIKLPIQSLNWNSIPNKGKLKKVIFQFEVKLTPSGNKGFSLVAYPAYRINGKWKIGVKISMLKIKGTEMHELKLPLTLGNLELKYTEVKNWLSPGSTKLTFIPHLYKPNAHAEYLVSDGINPSELTAKPSPPAPPEA